MARFSKSLASYSDIHQAFVAAIQLGTITLDFDRAPVATVWAARANAYRVLLCQQNADIGKGYSSPFDHLMVCRPKGTLQVVIKPRGFTFKSATGPNGEVLSFGSASLVASPVPVASPEELEAAAFLDALEKGELE